MAALSVFQCHGGWLSFIERLIIRIYDVYYFLSNLVCIIFATRRPSVFRVRTRRNAPATTELWRLPPRFCLCSRFHGSRGCAARSSSDETRKIIIGFAEFSHHDYCLAYGIYYYYSKRYLTLNANIINL